MFWTIIKLILFLWCVSGLWAYFQAPESTWMECRKYADEENGELMSDAQYKVAKGISVILFIFFGFMSVIYVMGEENDRRNNKTTDNSTEE